MTLSSMLLFLFLHDKNFELIRVTCEYNSDKRQIAKHIAGETSTDKK